MQQPLPTRAPTVPGPTFYLTGRQRLSPATILLAIVMAVSALYGLVYAMSHSRHGVFSGSDAARAGSAAAGAGADDDKDDDPNQVDTIVLGDPGDAPVPARHGDHVSPVHATIVVRLPRTGEQVGLIPNTASGRLLYGWLAAFNHADAAALGSALPTVAPGATESQMELRRETGGFFLLSAKEVQPGVLVFRLVGQAAVGEALGTLQVRAGYDSPGIGSFSLRGVGGAGMGPGAAGLSAAAGRR